MSRRTQYARSLALLVFVVGRGALAGAQSPLFDPDALASRGLASFGTPAVGKPPIILAHGFGGTEDPNAFKELATHLDEAGFSVFVFGYEASMVKAMIPANKPFTAMNLETFIKSLNGMADVSARLAEGGEYVAGILGSEVINYIGFSAGGVGALGAASTFPDHPNQYTLAGKSRHVNIITLDSPLHGTSELTFTGASFVAFLSDIQPPVQVYFYELMGNRRSWYLNGTPGANVTWFLFYSPDSGVVTPPGQQPINGKPIGSDTLKGTHGQAPTLYENIQKIVRKALELNPVQAPPVRTRRVSSADLGEPRDQYAAASAPPLRVGFGSDLRYESIDDISFASGTSTLTATRNGQIVATQTTTDSAAEQNSGFDHPVDLEFVAAHAEVPLYRLLDEHLEPSVNAAVGRATATLTLNRNGTSSSQRFTSNGLFGSVGGTATWLLSPTEASTWHVSGGVGFEGIRDLAVARTPPLAAPPGAVLTETDTLTVRARTIHAIVGWRGSRFAVSGGVRGVQRRIKLAGDVMADFSTGLGVPAVQTIHFENEYRENSADAIAGAAVQLGDTPLVAYADVAAGANHRTVQFGVSFNPSLRIARDATAPRTSRRF